MPVNKVPTNIFSPDSFYQFPSFIFLRLTLILQLFIFFIFICMIFFVCLIYNIELQDRTPYIIGRRNVQLPSRWTNRDHAELHGGHLSHLIPIHAVPRRGAASIRHDPRLASRPQGKRRLSRVHDQVWLRSHDAHHVGGKGELGEYKGHCRVEVWREE